MGVLAGAGEIERSFRAEARFCAELGLALYADRLARCADHASWVDWLGA